MKKTKVTLNEIRGEISSHISSLGLSRREFIEQMLADKKCPESVREKTPGTIMVTLSDSGSASFPIISGIYEYLGLGTITTKTKVQHIKDVSYYAERNSTK